MDNIKKSSTSKTSVRREMAGKMCAVYDEETWLYIHDFMLIGTLKWCNIWPFVFHFQTFTCSI